MPSNSSVEAYAKFLDERFKKVRESLLLCRKLTYV